MIRRTWTRESVVEAIRARREQGLPLANMRHLDGVLWRAARKHWGRWNTALQAAGIPAKPHRRWTRQQLLDAIRLSSSLGEANTRWRHDRSFVHSAARRFGSWQAALRAAGVPLYRRDWSRPAVVEAIQQLHREGVPTANVWKHDNALYAAAKNHFGTWKQALRAAGLRCGRQSWTSQRVVETIRRRLRRGHTLTQMASDHALACAAHLYYGGWGRALLAAGVNYVPPRRWMRQKVLDEMRSRQQQGLPMVSSCPDISGLVAAARRHFGSWSNALQAANVAFNLNRWTKQRVIEQIRRQYAKPARDRARRRQQYLQTVSRRFFDSWPDALSAAGIIPTRERILEVLQDDHVRGGCLEELRRRDPSLAAAARTTFGSWRKAVVAAGLGEAKR